MKKNPGRKRVKAKTPPGHLRHTKGDDFLKKLHEDNSMVEYFTRLRILNPAATLLKSLNEPRREGGFVRLAHAREEFTAPILTKGKSVQTKERKKGRAKRKPPRMR